MGGQPTGTVTHLFTDIEGSTRLWEQCPEAMQEGLVRHDAILQDAIAAHGGHVVKTFGDGFYAVFATATDALAGALAGQRALQAEGWGEAVIQVRMGLHTGAAEERDGDYFGPALNRAARLMAAGHGGQILLSRATRELVRNRLPAGVGLRDLGKCLFEGLARPEQVFQVVAPGLPAEFPPLRTVGVRPNNLPAQTTPFVGREAELAELGRLLADPGVRLVTILGAGGMGKTRLALEAAAARLDRFEHGVFVVSLAPLDRIEAIVPTIAEALGFSFHTEGRRGSWARPQQQLLDYLRHKSMLLIMDNYEHLLEGVNLVSEVLKAAVSVKVLATSRAKLKLHGEHLFPVAGMDLPDRERSGVGMETLPQTPQIMARYSAIQLFLQGARRAQPAFELGADNIADVVRICHLVAGMPLGILLAAGWLDTLTPAEIASEMQSLDFLETDLRDVPERQRSMRNVFDHSWNLLTTRQRAAMQALSVFRGGFTREAAGEVAGASLGELSALVHRSLLQRAPTARYEMHELLRQFAAEHLERVPGAREAVRDRHSAYYAAYLQQRDAALQGRHRKQALAEIGVEIENVRAAWNWAVARSRLEDIDRSVASMSEFYRIRGWFQDGEEAFAAAAKALKGLREARADRESELLLGKVLLQQGRFSDFLGHAEGAEALLRKSVAIFRELGTPKELAYALCYLGGSARYWKVDPDTKYQEALGLFEELGDQRGVALSVRGLGWAAVNLGEYRTAQQAFEKSLRISRKLGNQEGIAASLDGLGYTAWLLGDYRQAKQLHQECLALYRDIGDLRGMADSLSSLTGDAGGLQEYEEAKQLCYESLRTYREIGGPWGEGLVLSNLAELVTVLGEYEDAAEYAQESIELHRNLGFSDSWSHRILGNALCGLGDLSGARKQLHQALETNIMKEAGLDLLALVGIAALLAAEGETSRALELLVLVLHHRASWQWAKDRAVPLVTELQAELPPDAVAATWERGRTLDLDVVVAELLVELGGYEVA